MNAKKNNASQVAHQSVGQRYIHTVVIFIRKAFSFVMLSETYNLKIQTKKASSVLSYLIICQVSSTWITN